MLSDTDVACAATSVAVCSWNRIIPGPMNGTDKHHITTHKTLMRDLRLNSHMSVELVVVGWSNHWMS